MQNINPRSIYSKISEFQNFVENSDIYVIFLSETWERENKLLQKIINLDDYQVISNVFQRKERGGRPALIINSKKFHVKNLTNREIQVKWGVEAVWAILTPKSISPSSPIQHIACAAIYSKPNSKSKSDLYDHIYEAYHFLSSKYQRGLQFILAGDTNELNLDPILSLSHRLQQVVKQPTRCDPITGKESLLDPIITTMSTFYQEPDCIEPLDVDINKKGKKSDNKIVVMAPINKVNQISARVPRSVKFRPYSESRMQKMINVLINENWDNVYSSVTTHEKAQKFQEMLLEKYLLSFPEKDVKFSDEDQPWMNDKLKKLDRKRKRIYAKNRMSKKWKVLNKQFKREVKTAKQTFYKNFIEDLKYKKPRKMVFKSEKNSLL